MTCLHSTYSRLDLPQFCSASLNGITAIKENNHGTSTQRRIDYFGALRAFRPSTDTALGRFCHHLVGPDTCPSHLHFTPKNQLRLLFDKSKRIWIARLLQPGGEHLIRISCHGLVQIKLSLMSNSVSNRVNSANQIPQRYQFSSGRISRIGWIPTNHITFL